MESDNDRRIPSLTRRESDVLALLLEGLSNREMGEKLHLSPLTIRDYISRLLLKYQVRSRTELAIRVIVRRRHHHRRLQP